MTAQYPKQRPDLFWLVIGLIVLAFCLSSCSRNFYCRHCPPETVKDSVFFEIHDSAVVHDTTIVVKSDTAIIHDSVPCADFKRVFHSGRASIEVEVKDSVMTAECVCDGIEAKLRWYEKFHQQVLNRFHSEQRTAITRVKVSWFAYWQSWLCLALLLFIFIKGILRRFGLRFAFVPAFPFITVVPIIKKSG